MLTRYKAVFYMFSRLEVAFTLTVAVQNSLTRGVYYFCATPYNTDIITGITTDACQNYKLAFTKYVSSIHPNLNL